MSWVHRGETVTLDEAMQAWSVADLEAAVAGKLGPYADAAAREIERRAAGRCRSCPHPPHLGACTKRNGGTAYACGCSAQTPERP